MPEDFTRYHGRLNDGSNDLELIYYEDAETRRQTSNVPLRPVRQDTGTNPYETRPESGDIFAQGDWSFGSGQERYHRPKADPSKFFNSEGFDIETPDKLTHLNGVSSITTGASATPFLFQAGGLPFYGLSSGTGTGINIGNGSFPGTWTSDTSAFAPFTAAVAGAEVFAGTSSTTTPLQKRSSGGTWAAYQAGGVDITLDGGACTKLAYVKDRLIAVGGTSSRGIYEIDGTDASPAAMLTLPEGWSFQSIFENGAYIYASAVNVNAGLSKIHHFGLNAAGSALEVKGSTPIPQNQFIYSGAGYLNLVYLGGGKRNKNGGYNAVIYQAVPSEDGFLDIAKLVEGNTTSSSDDSVRAILPQDEKVFFSWTETDDSGNTRHGIAVHHIGRDAFARHLYTSTTARVADIMVYQGRIVMASGDGKVYYETLDTPKTSAELITSIADWNNAGLKSWRTIEIQHKPLAASTQVQVYYSVKHPDENTWVSAGISSTLASEGAVFNLSGITSRTFALKLVSTASGSNAPTITGFSVRSDPYVSSANAEWRLTRYIRVMNKNQKDGQAPIILKNPTTIRNSLAALLFAPVTLYEQDATWSCRVERITEVVPKLPFFSSTAGDPHKNVYIVAIELQGVKTA